MFNYYNNFLLYIYSQRLCLVCFIFFPIETIRKTFLLLWKIPLLLLLLFQTYFNFFMLSQHFCVWSFMEYVNIFKLNINFIKRNENEKEKNLHWFCIVEEKSTFFKYFSGAEMSTGSFIVRLSFELYEKAWKDLQMYLSHFLPLGFNLKIAGIKFKKAPQTLCNSFSKLIVIFVYKFSLAVSEDILQMFEYFCICK